MVPGWMTARIWDLAWPGRLDGLNLCVGNGVSSADAAAGAGADLGLVPSSEELMTPMTMAMTNRRAMPLRQPDDFRLTGAPHYGHLSARLLTL